jgi:hypothetical protein
MEGVIFYSTTQSMLSPKGIWGDNNNIFWSSRFNYFSYIFLNLSPSYPSVKIFTPLIIKNLNKKNFFLKQEVRIDIEMDISTDGYILSNDALNVYAFGTNIANALSEWKNVLIDLYLSYRDTPNGELTGSARVLKDRLQKAIGESNAD